MKRRIAAMLLCVVLALALFPCAAFAQEPLRTVRVGFFPLSGYHMVDEKGNRSGYGYDLLQQLRVYSDWTYEYIGYDKSWEAMFGMLERGEIDLLTVVHKTQERESLFDFSDEPVGYSSTIVTAKPDSGVSFTGDYKSWDGARVGMAPGDKRNDGFAVFAQEHDFSYTPVYFDTTEELIAALKNEDGIDLAVSSDQRAISDEVVLAKFDAEPYYIAVKKGDMDLLQEVNAALEMLAADTPGFRTSLALEYFSANNENEIAYTAQERAFIAGNADTVFTAALCPDRPPISDFENGAATGFLADISAEIISRTGLNIQILETATRSEYNALIESGVPDIILDDWYNYSNAEQRGYKLAHPYLDVTITRLYLKEQSHALNDIHTIAMIRNSDLSLKYGDELSQRYEITYYDTVEEVIAAVYTGRQDTAYLFYHTAEKALYDDLTNRMSTDELYAYSFSFSIAANNNQNHLLLSILSKAAGSISDSEIENSILQHTSYPLHPFSFVGYLYDNPVSSVFVLVCLFVLLMIAALFVYTTKKHRRERAQMLEEQRKNQLLKDALEIAEKADASKSRFLSNVSHEMRTPLNAIIGFMTLAEKEDGAPAKMSSYLKNSTIAAKQLLSIINDVLDMSAIESGKMKIDNAPFELNQILEPMTALYQAQCAPKGVVYETKILPPLEPWVVGDSLRLSQILNNLLSNAVKFTKQGYVRLTVRQTNTAEHKVFIRFEVSDTGCGMSEELLTRWGKPFEQESSAIAKKYGGSGLGLSIVRSLISLMGGAVDVQSTQGQGTTFTVDLPFEKAGLQSTLAHSEISSADSVEPAPQMESSLSGCRILLAEDNEINRLIAVELLQDCGIACDEAEDGKIALDKFTGSAPGTYSAIIMDIRMPVMDGYEATKAIRSSGHPDAKAIPIVALSANAFSEDITQALQSGMDAHISKPLDVKLLISTLSRFVGSTRETIVK